MMKMTYRGYDVLAKWDSPSFDDTTRMVLSQRLGQPPPRRFFSPDEFERLEALVDRLAPQDGRSPRAPLANWIDALMLDAPGEGYRQPDMPPLPEAWRRALSGFAAEARRRFACGFTALEGEQQDAVISAVQAGDVDRAAWARLDPARFFVDHILKTVAGLAYAQPAAWSEIGFGGPASPRGYVRLGIGERDPWEAAAEAQAQQ
ncbi:MAG: gluconate 2-dehydrogenase subunit 3 family protein [Phenylobacterium sp.]